MPRPKNELVRTFVTRNASNEYVCNHGKCKNKLLIQDGAHIERHLRLHPEIFAKYIHKKSAWKQKFTAAAAVATTQKQPKTENTKKNHNFELAIVELFTKCKQPLSLLDQRAFKILVQPAFEKLGIQMDKQSVLELIHKFSQKTKCDIIKDLSANCTLYTLTIYIRRKEEKHALMDIIVQYIRNQQIENKILAIRLLDRKFTSESLKSIIIDTLKEYTIDLKQILSITTSEDTNIIEAIKSLKDELNSVFTEEGVVASTSIKTETKDANDVTEEFIEYSTSDYSTPKITILLDGVHILKACLEILLSKEEVKRVLDKCRTVIKQLRPQTLDSATNWISTYELMMYILKVEDISIFINYQDINFLNNLINLLKLIGVAVNKLEDETTCYSDLFIIIMNLVFDLEKITYEKSTVKYLIDALNWHKQKLLEIDQFNAAVYLDPRIRVCLDAVQKKRAKQYITKLHDRICVLKSRSGGGGDESVHSEANDGLLMDTNTTQPESTTSNNPCSPKSFSDYLENIDFDSTSATFSYLEDDITLYELQPRLPLETNILDFWYFQRNSLADIARLILATPCSKSYIKRLPAGFELCFSDENSKLSTTEMDQYFRVMVNGIFYYEE